MFKFFLIISVLCFAHADVTPEDLEKLQIADKELEDAISTVNLNVKNATETTTNNINESKVEIEFDIKIFNEEVEEAEREAQVFGKDIDLCVKVAQAGSQELGSNIVQVLETCQHTILLKFIEVSKNQLSSLHNVLNAQNKCNLVDNSSLCVANTITDVQRETETIQSVIMSVLDEIKIQNCVKNTYDSIELSLKTIKDHWDICCNN